MSKLITKGNLAIFEHPQTDEDASYTLEENGVLWVSGYLSPIMGKPIRAMKRFETGLKSYIIIGDYKRAKEMVKGDFSEMVEGQNIDTANCVVMISSKKE